MEENYKNANCEILNDNVVVARQVDSVFDIVRPDLLPLYLKRLHSVDSWLKTRAIDKHRTNSRLVKRALRLSNENDLETVWKVNAATITDRFWVRPLHSELRYEDIRFKENYFAELALHGTSFSECSESPHKHTPELTNTGSFEKCWKQIDGSWYLIKQANEREAFSEVFISKLGERIGLDIAQYDFCTDGVITKDFTNGAEYNFEPAFSVIDDDSYNGNYEIHYETLSKAYPDIGPEFVQMIFADAVFYNPDRHLGNFGFLTDPKDGHIEKMAPLFDHNLALISRDLPTIGRSDMLIRDFAEFVSRHPEYESSIPDITREDMDSVLAEMPDSEHKEYVAELVLGRYEICRDIIREKEFDPDR